MSYYSIKNNVTGNGRLFSEETVIKFLILEILLHIELILAIYINIRMLVIICFTYRRENNTSYYPILLIMVILTCFNTIVLIFHVLAALFWATVIHFDIRIFCIPVVIALVAPTLVSLLDLILCVHRLLAFFGSFESNTIRFRWFGPILFFLISPLVICVAFRSQMHTVSKTYFKTANTLLVWFTVDNSMKVLFGFISVCGYLLIMMKMKRSTRKSRQPREDSSVLRQAFPIASFQLFSALVQVFLELPLNPKILGDPERLILDLCLSCACSIVVPLSIIAASSQKREMFLESCCNCHSPKTPPHKQCRFTSQTATNYMVTRF